MGDLLNSTSSANSSILSSISRSDMWHPKHPANEVVVVVAHGQGQGLLESQGLEEPRADLRMLFHAQSLVPVQGAVPGQRPGDLDPASFAAATEDGEIVPVRRADGPRTPRSR